jgi:hypothetical protein
MSSDSINGPIDTGVSVDHQYSSGPRSVVPQYVRAVKLQYQLLTLACYVDVVLHERCVQGFVGREVNFD